MAQVFVSYSRHDEPRVRPILESLGKAGFGLSHPRSTAPGPSIADAIAQDIAAADCLLVLWSKAAAASQWVQRDLHLAIEAWSAGKLVLVSLDDAELPVGLRDLETIRLHEERRSDLSELLNRVQSTQRGPTGALASLRPISFGAPAPMAEAPTSPRRAASRWRLVGGVLALLILAGAGAYIFSPGSTPTPVGEAESPSGGAPAPGSEPRPAPPPDDGGLFPLPETPPSEPSLGSWEINRDLEREFNPLLLAMATGLAGILIGAGLAFAFWRWRRRRGAQPRDAAAPAVTPTVLPITAPPLPENLPVFVSYSREDLRDVDPLVRQIEQAGYGVWIDRQAHGSQRYAAPIVRAIKASQLVALMCSQNAFKSDHVIRELYIAGDYKKPFLVFQLDTAEFPDEVLYFVTGFPRLSVTALDPQGLRSELSRLLVN